MRRAAAFLLAACVLPAAAADQVWTAAPDALLADMRGGFALPGGFMVSFGIVRTVQVDGQVVSQTSLQIPDLRAITVDQARQLGQAADLMLVQTGPGNAFQPLQAPALPGIVIQNTESNRRLQALTEITATANTLRALQALNLNQVLGDALRGALGR